MVFAANAKGERLGYPTHFGSIAESYPATFSEESHRTIVEEAIHNSFVDTKINYEELNYMIDCMSHYASTFGRDMNLTNVEMHESICKSLNEAKGELCILRNDVKRRTRLRSLKLFLINLSSAVLMQRVNHDRYF